jgi:hypothetical protein
VSEFEQTTYTIEQYHADAIDQEFDHRPEKGSTAPIAPGSELWDDYQAVLRGVAAWEKRRRERGT